MANEWAHPCSRADNEPPLPYADHTESAKRGGGVTTHTHTHTSWAVPATSWFGREVHKARDRGDVSHSPSATPVGSAARRPGLTTTAGVEESEWCVTAGRCLSLLFGLPSGADDLRPRVCCWREFAAGGATALRSLRRDFGAPDFPPHAGDAGRSVSSSSPVMVREGARGGARGRWRRTEALVDGGARPASHGGEQLDRLTTLASARSATPPP